MHNYKFMYCLAVFLVGCGSSGSDIDEKSAVVSNFKVNQFLSAINQVNHCGTTQDGWTNNSEEVSIQVDDVISSETVSYYCKNNKVALDSKGNFSQLNSKETCLDNSCRTDVDYTRSVFSIHNEHMYIYNVESESDFSNLILPIEDDTYFYSVSTSPLTDGVKLHRESNELYSTMYSQLLNSDETQYYKLYVRGSDNLIYKVDSDSFNDSIQASVNINMSTWLVMDFLLDSILDEGDLSNDAQQDLYLTSDFDVSNNFDVNNFKYYYNKLKSTFATNEPKLLAIP
ncbi:hypothetical protein [Vibrio sp.]|uniref:hypothetical protein n=1 Tax=Vibrio sp. TaxID=678 RepID=UPI003AA9BDCE